MGTTKALIIPAAGKGKRMQRNEAKPYISLQGQPILAHSIQRFLPIRGLKEILIAAAGEYLHAAHQILQQTVGDSISWKVIEGGSTRQDSIYNAIKALPPVDLVMVHDAVRPFVRSELVETCCLEAEKTGAAVPGIPSKNTLKFIDEDHRVTETPDRAQLWQVQTPQIFDNDLLKQAYFQADARGYIATDDASLVEWLGKPVKIVRGTPDNIKITYPRDLQLAEIILKNENKTGR
jgi:2-C-methyl-D-erythritol 4-phosphate cytidylyltransferase